MEKIVSDILLPARLDDVGNCPFVRVGDLITIIENYRRRQPINIFVIAQVFNDNIKGCCGAFKNLNLILGSNNEFYHPGNDVSGIDCVLCPYKSTKPKVIDSPKWAEKYWGEFMDNRQGLWKDSD